MQFGHDQLGVFGDLVNSGTNGHEAVTLEREPRTELLRRQSHRVLTVLQREDRPVPDCHPDPIDFPEPTRRRRLDHYGIARPYGQNVRFPAEYVPGLGCRRTCRPGTKRISVTLASAVPDH